MMLSYKRLEVGIFAVGGLSFVHCFFFYITKELDNPNCWDLEIPTDWIDELQKAKMEVA